MVYHREGAKDPTSLVLATTDFCTTPGDPSCSRTLTWDRPTFVYGCFHCHLNPATQDRAFPRQEGGGQPE